MGLEDFRRALDPSIPPTPAAQPVSPDFGLGLCGPAEGSSEPFKALLGTLDEADDELGQLLTSDHAENQG